MIAKAVQHPYNVPVFGGALTGYGGTDFFLAMVLGAPASLAPPGIFALLGQPKYEVPTDIQGLLMKTMLEVNLWLFLVRCMLIYQR